MAMRDIWKTNGGIYLGFRTDHTEGDPPPLYDAERYIGDRGIITIGPNGSGKSRRSLLVNVCELTGWSKIIVDPKGDIYTMTNKHLKDAKNTVIRLNPFDAANSDGFNPISSLGGSKKNRTVLGI